MQSVRQVQPTDRVLFLCV